MANLLDFRLVDGVIVYGDGLRLDVDAVRRLVDQPIGTRLIRPDGTGVEWLGRQGDAIVLRDIRETDAIWAEPEKEPR